MDAISLSLKSLPVIVAGSVVRRLTRTKISVWVALTEPDDITLRVSLMNVVATASSQVTTEPVQVDSNLWMSVLTADGLLCRLLAQSAGFCKTGRHRLVIRSVRLRCPLCLDGIASGAALCDGENDNKATGVMGTAPALTARLTPCTSLRFDVLQEIPEINQ